MCFFCLSPRKSFVIGLTTSGFVGVVAVVVAVGKVSTLFDNRLLKSFLKSIYMEKKSI